MEETTPAATTEAAGMTQSGAVGAVGVVAVDAAGVSEGIAAAASAGVLVEDASEGSRWR